MATLTLADIRYFVASVDKYTRKPTVLAVEVNRHKKQYASIFLTDGCITSRDLVYALTQRERESLTTTPPYHQR